MVILQLLKPESPSYQSFQTDKYSDHSHTRVKISDVKSLSIIPQRRVSEVCYTRHRKASQRVGNKTKISLTKKHIIRVLIASDTVRIEKLGSVRGKKLASLMISLLQYDPLKNTLEVITSMKIAVIFDANARIRAQSTRIQAFNESLAKGVVNYILKILLRDIQQTLEMIILTDTTFRNHLNHYNAGKHRRDTDCIFFIR